MTQTRSIPIRESDSGQGPSLRVIDNPQLAAPKRSEGGQKNLGITLSPLQAAHSRMVAELSLLAPSIPQPSSDPTAEEIAEFKPYLIAVGQVFDRHIRACGLALSSVVLGVDLAQFTDVVMCGNGLEGNALHECDAAIDAVEEGIEIRTGMWGA